MVEDGYRLRVREVRDLALVMDGFRADALRLLARSLGRSVATEAVRRLDLNSIGRLDPPSGTSPLEDANAAIREAYLAGSMDLDCEIAIHLVGDAVLAVFSRGNADYRKAWEGRREVVRWGWSETAVKPKAISELNWKNREICWRAAIGKTGLPTCLRYRLLDGPPPALGWGGIRRHLPALDERVRMAMSTLAPDSSASPELLAEHRRRMATKLPREVTREMLGAYGRAAARQPGREARSRVDAPSVGASIIDHADVVQASDGRVFVAVPYVGMAVDDRVFLQVAERHVAITQNATQYGFVSDVPRIAVDLLRDCKTVTLVEVEVRNGQRLLRARHVAIVQDISLSEGVGRSLGRWRARGSAGRNDGEITVWDSRESRTTE